MVRKKSNKGVNPGNAINQPDEELNKLLEEMRIEDQKSLNELLLTEIGEATPRPDPDPNATADDVAQWIQHEVEDRYHLEQEHAIREIEYRFGERFVYLNGNGNSAIVLPVLKAFLKRTQRYSCLGQV